MKIFGSDGFRCTFGTKFLTVEMIMKFSHAIGDHYLNQGMQDPILISRDTRDSGKIIENLLSSVLIFKGIDFKLTGIMPTPGISKLLEIGNYSLGIMITASHNPYQDNGIKLLGHNGFKLDLDSEKKIESLMQIERDHEIKQELVFSSDRYLESSFLDYAKPIIDDFKTKNFDSKILIDCANGAFSKGIENLLAKHKNISYVDNIPNGQNINLNCGALEANRLLDLVRRSGQDFGVAFDGDGDRAIFVSKEYGVIEIEKLAYLFFKMLDNNNKKVISTEICNLALRHNLENIGATLSETEVGDRFVVDSVNQTKALFGFEPSGHFYFPKYSRSMDGLVTALHFFDLIYFLGDSLDEKLHLTPHYEREKKDIYISEDITINMELLRLKVEDLYDNNSEKLIIRRSMWDPVIRVYYDFINENNFNRIEESIKSLIPELRV